MLTKTTLLLIWLLGLISGFSLMISGNTLNFWLSKEKVDINTIGIFAIVSLPYAINFLWAPIFDSQKLPVLTKYLGQRISWTILAQFLLSLTIFLLSLINPGYNLLLFSFLSLLIAFFASAQDTILGALRTEIVNPLMQKEVSGIYSFGYRIGMLISGPGAIYLSYYLPWNSPWNSIYKLFSIIILFFSILLLIAKSYIISLSTANKNNDDDNINNIPGNNIQTNNIRSLPGNLFTRIITGTTTLITAILKPIGSGSYVLLILSFLILYRLPDNFINAMINSFLLHIGYNDWEIATAGKLFGSIGAIIGGLISSAIMRRINLLNSLLIFGSIHALAHLFFIIQEIYGKNLYLLFVIIGFESISGGMSMASYIAFIASLCRGKFRATQYSFFSAMMGLSRSVLPVFSGYIVTDYGWKSFYLLTTIMTFPALYLILYLKKYQKS